MALNDSSFLRLRPELFGLAYRMLGSAVDAEDVVQESYLRWRRSGYRIRSPRAFMTTVVVRLCLDELSSARARREHYVGPWLPEPLLVDEADPADAAALADTLSLAFLVVLEELSPAERAAFLLHDVLDYRYEEIATILTRAPTACRQLVARARGHVAARRHRFDTDQQRVNRLSQQFATACATGDLDGLLALLTEDIVVWTDGGGKAKSARRPINGATKAARFLIGITRSLPAGARVRQVGLNGQPGFVINQAGVIANAVVLDVVEGRISAVRVIANPDKLRAVNSALAAAGGTGQPSDVLRLRLEPGSRS